MEEKPVCCSRGVDVVGDRPQVDLALFEIAGELDQVLHRPAEPVEFPNHKRIAGPGVIEGLGQPRTIPGTATDLIGIDPSTAILVEGFPLQVKVLIVGGDPGVADPCF